jgi:hypothetical protein
MTRILGVFAFCIAFALCNGGVRAAQPTPVPDMKPDFSSVSFMLGTWSCHGMVRGSSRPDTATYTMDYDGHWMKLHDTAPPFDKYRTRSVIMDTWMTYNDTMHEWVQTSVDNFGGYGMATSPGWRGNRMTWTSSVTPDGTTGSDVFTKISDTETRDVYTSRSRSGMALPTQTTTCVKQ